MNQKKERVSNSILVAVITVIIVAGGYFILSKKSITPTGTQQTPQQTDTTNWKTYRNEEYGFEFKYPENFAVGKYKPETLPNAEETRKIFEQVGYSSKEIDEKLSPFKNSVVLVEKSIAIYFNDIQVIPVGRGFGITIKLNTGENGKFLLDSAIKLFEAKDRQELKIDSFTITKLPGYPGPYGDSVFYYVLKANDDLVIEFSGFKKYPKGPEFQKPETDTDYDETIEEILSTFKLSK